MECIFTGAFDLVRQSAAELGLGLRTAAFVAACRRVLSARELRGLYP